VVTTAAARIAVLRRTVVLWNIDIRLCLAFLKRIEVTLTVSRSDFARFMGVFPEG
jgi:hypothetical protein